MPWKPEVRIYERLDYSFHQPIACIVLNHPGDANRVDLTMAMELRQVTQQVHEDGADVAVVTGTGHYFSVGRVDLTCPQGTDSRQWLEMHRAASALAAVSIPVIAAINGDALGQGLELALACDFRIAVQGAKLGIADPPNGCMPWDGGTQRLPQLVGRAVALEMLLMGRVLEAEEALKAGLVNMVVPPEKLDDQVQSFATKISKNAPIALRYAKEAVLKGADMTLEQGLGLEADLNIILQSTKDRAEGISSFLEHRTPWFAGE